MGKKFMLKAGTSLLILIIIFVSTMSAFMAEEENPVQIDNTAKNIVSVVFDDSVGLDGGSSKNWAYANYGLQYLTSLLSNEDEMYITYTSNPKESQEISGFKDNRQDSIDSIKGHKNSATPTYTAVETALAKLRSIQNANVNTHYSLVIITGSNFKTSETNSKQLSSNVLDTKFRAMQKVLMANQQSVKVHFLATNSKIAKPKSSLTTKVYNVSGYNITSELIKMANSINVRFAYKSSDFTRINNKIVEVNVELPLESISVSTFKTGIKTKSINDSTGLNINPIHNVSLGYPNVSRRTTDKSLQGSVCIFKKSEGAIAPGKYKIEFTEDIDDSAFEICYAPALEVAVDILKDGQIVTDFSSIKSEDMLDIRASLKGLGGAEIKMEELPVDISYEIIVYEKEVEKKKANALELKGVLLNINSTTILVKIKREGFFEIQSDISLNPGEATMYTIQIENINFEEKETNVGLSGKKLRIYPLADGKKFDATSVQTLDFQVVADPNLDLESNWDDNYKCFEVKPKARWIPFGIPTGTITIKASILGNISATKTITIKKVSIFEKLLLVWILLIIIIIICLYIMKKKFKRGDVIYYTDCEIDYDGNISPQYKSNIQEWSQIILSTKSGNRLIPVVADKFSLDGIIFTSGGDGQILVSKQQIGDYGFVTNYKFDRTESIDMNIEVLKSKIVSKKQETSQNYKLVNGNALCIRVNGDQLRVVVYESKSRVLIIG